MNSSVVVCLVCTRGFYPQGKRGRQRGRGRVREGQGEGGGGEEIKELLLMTSSKRVLQKFKRHLANVTVPAAATWTFTQNEFQCLLQPVGWFSEGRAMGWNLFSRILGSSPGQGIGSLVVVDDYKGHEGTLRVMKMFCTSLVVVWMTIYTCKIPKTIHHNRVDFAVCKL